MEKLLAKLWGEVREITHTHKYKPTGQSVPPGLGTPRLYAWLSRWGREQSRVLTGGSWRDRRGESKGVGPVGQSKGGPRRPHGGTRDRKTTRPFSLRSHRGLPLAEPEGNSKDPIESRAVSLPEPPARWRMMEKDSRGDITRSLVPVATLTIMTQLN